MCHCSSGCTGCKAVTGVVTLLVTLATIAAALGVWQTHMTDSGWVFGAAEGSWALLAFVVSVTVWTKFVAKFCPCGKGDTCSGCGHSPCTCGK